MAAPYNPPTKGQDFSFRMALPDMLEAGAAGAPDIEHGDFIVYKDGAPVYPTTLPILHGPVAPSDAVLHIPANGADGSTSFVDAMGLHTVTAINSAQMDTTRAKFGPSSLYCPANSSALTLDGHSDFAFGTGDYTIACWVYREQGANIYQQVVKFRSADEGITLRFSGSSASFTAYLNGTGGGLALSTGSFPNDQWVHVALTRAGGVARLFINGVQVGGAVNDTTNHSIDSGRPVWGADNGWDAGYFWMDDMLVVKGRALWTSNFTPPGGKTAEIYLSASEMDADVVTVVGHDQSQPPLWGDVCITILTTQA